MDFFLFVILLVGFAALYVALSIYLVYTLVILIVIALFYIALRYPNGKGDWPWGFTDNIYLVGMTTVIILVFMIVVPQAHWIGSQLTYDPAPPKAPEGWEVTADMRNPYNVLMLFVMTGIIFLIMFAVLVPYLQMQMSGMSKGGGGGDWEKDSGKPKIGVGA